MIELPDLELLTFFFGIAGLSFICGQCAVSALGEVRKRKWLRNRLSPLRRHAPSFREELGSVPQRSAPQFAAAHPGSDGNEIELQRLLHRFGLNGARSRMVMHVFRGLCIAFASGLLLAASLLFNARGEPFAHLLATLIGGAIGWFFPKVLLGRLAVRHRRAVTEALPDAIELLVVAVEAGLSLEDAIDRVTAELRHSRSEMAEELAITSADLKVLPDRDDALHRLADRIDSASIRAVVTTLLQTLRYGTPLAHALRIVAAELRNNAVLRIEEQAGRLPALLTVPMILFLLPCIFLVIGGPVFLRLLHMFHWAPK